MVIDRTLLVGSPRARLLTRMKREARAAGFGDVRRVHLIVSIDRLLVRLSRTATSGSWVVKGGFANQLRRPTEARFTEDIDLRIDSAIDTAPELLAQAFADPVEDLFSFEAASAPVAIQGPPGGGLRFVVVARVAGAELVRFKVDVSALDVVVGDFEEHLSDPIMERLGYERSRFPVYPIAQHVAEKLQALTLPRGSQQNTRSRDLVDLVWFAERFGASSSALIDAATATFARRAVHAWPPTIEPAPGAWSTPYTRYVKEMGLRATNTSAGIETVRKWLRPVLVEERDLAWDPDLASWS